MIKGGLSGSALLGQGYDFTWGGKTTALIGYSANYRKGPFYEYVAGSKFNLSQRDSVISAKGKLNLVGGASENDPTSIAVLDTQNITLSFGTNKNPRKDASGIDIFWMCVYFVGVFSTGGLMAWALEGKKSAKGKILISALALCELVFLILLTHKIKNDVIGKPQTISHFDDARDKIDSLIKLDGQGISLAVDVPQLPAAQPPGPPPLTNSKSMINIQKAGPIIINSKPVNDADNKITMGVGDITAADTAQDARIILSKSATNIDIQSGASNIWMKKDGDIKISNQGATVGQKSIVIYAEGDAWLRSKTGDVMLDAPAGQVWARGSIKHKNFKVLA
jgi:hypothetical protein